MKTLLKTSLHISLLVFSLQSFAAPKSKSKAPSAEELLKAADRARGAVAATEGITWKITVVSKDAQTDNTVKYIVQVKGDDALAEAIDPPGKKGELMLFNDRNLHYYKPGKTRKPMPISPRQKLLGQAANGDIASTNYYRDYDGTVVGEEKINDTQAWKLELKAKAKNVTYDKIIYWVSKQEKLGVKADFLTVSGEKVKSSTFEYKNKMNIGSEQYPFVSKMTIADALNTKSITTIDYQEPKQENHADSRFNVNNLAR